MVEAYICKDCIHFDICKVNDKISVFDEETKKSLGVDIKILGCENFKEVE